CQPKVWSDAPIIEEYESDSEDEYVFIPTKEQETSSFANQQVKTPRETVKNHFTHSKNPKVDKKELRYRFTARACLVCGSLNHLIRDCDFHEKRMAKQVELNSRLNRNSSQREIRPIWNNVQRVNNQNQFVPTAVLTRTGKFQLILLELADYPHRALQNKGIVDSGCSRHMTRNKAYLAEYQDFNGGPVAFGGSKGYITSKEQGSIDSECLVLSPEFKLPDENQILLRIPRQNNMYSFNLENIVPSGGLACLIAKATIDESNKWHRRLGHVNFKNLNKLVKGNLVRGLPSKIFQNDHTCVACQKGKQHKASCKAKSVSSISHSLQLLHMDLFGPTSVRSLNHKTYCLVITDDFSRFSWVFFLRTKDETSGILKDFIRQIENQLNQKVKTIRCDNGTEFKNRDFIEFCGSKGIKREYIFLNFNVGTAHQACLNAERLKTEAAEAVRLRVQVSAAKAVEKVHADVNVVVSSIKSQNDGLVDQVHALETTCSSLRDQVAKLDLDLLEMALHLEEKFYPYLLTTISGQRWLLTHGLKIVVVNCLNSPEYLTTLGSAISHAIEKGMQSGLSAGIDHRKAGRSLGDVVAYNHAAEVDYNSSLQKLRKMDFPLITELNSHKDASVADIMDLLYLESPLANALGMSDLQPNVEQLTLPIYQPEDQVVLGETSLSFALSVAHSRFEKIRENVAVQRSALIDVWVPLVDLLSAKNLVGTSSTSGHVPATIVTTTALSTTFSSASSFPPISTDDYEIVVCACSRFQVTPKTSHLSAAKRIFRYLKGKPKLGLWYPRVSSFNLEAYSDSDYARANLDKKSPTGGRICGCCQLLWQVLWIQNQMLDYGFNFMNTKIYIDNESTICIVKNPIYHSKTKHIAIRHHFIRDAYEKKLIQVLKIHTDDNVADLLTKAFDVSRFQFLVVTVGMINPKAAFVKERQYEFTAQQNVSTDKEKVSTDRPKVSTDRPKVSTDGSKVSTDKEKDSSSQHEPSQSSFKKEKSKELSLKLKRSLSNLLVMMRWLDCCKRIGKQKKKRKRLADEKATIHSHLKTKKFEEIQALYEKIKRSDEDFITIGSVEDEIMMKRMMNKELIIQKNESCNGGGVKRRICDDEHRKCLKSVIARLDKVSSPDGDYLVLYRANGNFRAFNYLMEIELSLGDSYEACGVWHSGAEDGICLSICLLKEDILFPKELLQKNACFGIRSERESTVAI
ncbi:putative ribonuclease H-like domain-containing protein, partial [Tanacetum coccineum]